MTALAPVASTSRLHDVHGVRAPLRDVLDALCFGLRATGGAGDDAEALRFKALAEIVRRRMVDTIPPEVQRLSMLGSVDRDAALSAARAGNDAVGTAAIARARAATADVSDATLTRFADTLTDAAAAYVEYKGGRHDEARALMLRSLDATNAMLRSYDCTAIHHRRVHLVANVIKLGAKNGDPGSALDVASDMLHYLEGDEARWPLDGYAVDAPIAAVSLDDRVTMSGQLGEEIALVLASAPGDAAALVDRFGPHASSAIPMGACAPFRTIHQWLHLRRAHAHGESAEFLGAARDFFAARQPLGFWMDAARLLDRWCTPIELEDAAEIRRTLAAATAARRKGPPSGRA